MTLVVQKYGGTSVGSIDRLQAVSANIAEWVNTGHQMVIVVSAMGTETDRLIQLANALHERPPQREMDMLLTAGERMSMSLLSIALHQRGIRAISLTGSQCGILTDETHGNARIHKITGERIKSALADGYVVIVAGYQGVNPHSKEITTLGRGGSDVTGVALAATLNADVCEIYTDVKGIFTADPRYLEQARPLTEITWEEMSELACQGAAVLHPRAAHMADRNGIPLIIRSSFQTEHPGTLVKGRCMMESAVITAIAHQDQLAMIDVRIPGAKGTSQWLSRVNAWLWQQGHTPLTAQQQLDPEGFSIRLLVPAHLQHDLEIFIETMATEVGCKPTSRTQGQLAGISLIGKGLLQNPELVGQVLSALPSDPAHVEVRNHAIIIGMPSETLKAALEVLHTFTQTIDSST